jgi:hypothetical protein
MPNNFDMVSGRPNTYAAIPALEMPFKVALEA